MFILTIGLMQVPVGAQDQPVAFKGSKIYPITRNVIENGVLVIQNGKINAIGDSSEVQIPDMAVVIDVSGKFIMPGLVNSHSHVVIYPPPPVQANSAQTK
jgi:imidazolonepropionase-like amidohydrolase